MINIIHILKTIIYKNLDNKSNISIKTPLKILTKSICYLFNN